MGRGAREAERVDAEFDRRGQAAGAIGGRPKDSEVPGELARHGRLLRTAAAGVLPHVVRAIDPLQHFSLSRRGWPDDGSVHRGEAGEQ